LKFALVAVLSACLVPSTAAADWLITPFLGTAFGGDTNFVVLGRGVPKKFTFGGSVALLSDRVFGVEFDVGHSPHFFEPDLAKLVVRSQVTTLSGSVIAAVPLAVTQESLRPYVVGGLGLMHANIDDFAQVFPVDNNLLAMTIGGGAIGLITNRTGVRFEIRQFKNLRREPNPVTGTGSAQLSFWRATAGVVIKY
jgi:opacity protein-like surface antigen